MKYNIKEVDMCNICSLDSEMYKSLTYFDIKSGIVTTIDLCVNCYNMLNDWAYQNFDSLEDCENYFKGDLLSNIMFCGKTLQQTNY